MQVCKYCDRKIVKEAGKPEFMAVPEYKGEPNLNTCSNGAYHRHYHWPR